MRQQLNTSKMCVYSMRIATLATEGAEWSDLMRWLDRLYTLASGYPRSVTGCIGHARAVALLATNPANFGFDDADGRGEVFADMEMLSIMLTTW